MMGEKGFLPKYKTKFMEVPMENAPAYESHVAPREETSQSGRFVATPYHKEDGTLAEGLEAAVRGKKSFLAAAEPMPAKVAEDGETGLLVMENGVLRREFHVPLPGKSLFYTKSLYNQYIERELMGNAPRPEVVLGLYDAPYRDIYAGTQIKRKPSFYSVGGLETGRNFVLDSYQIIETCEKPFAWSPSHPYSDPSAGTWPPKGKRVEFLFAAGEAFPKPFSALQVKVIYELYDSLPVMKKRVEVTNAGNTLVTLGRLVVESLGKTREMDALLYMETTYTGGYDGTIPLNTPLPCKCGEEGEDSPLHPLHGTHHACYEAGPAYELKKGETFRSFDVYELVHSTYWFESRALERLAMYRVLFPWITDNPLTFHSTKPLSKKIIDHAARAGFELVIQSFGMLDRSKQMMTNSKRQMKKYKKLVEYAHQKGVSLGIYQAQYQLGQYKKGPSYGTNGLGTWNTWCMAGDAFRDYWPRFLRFLKETGLDCVEIDGPYPNCYCDNGEAHEHQGEQPFAVHQGYYDSQVKQWENAVRRMTAAFRDMGIYVQVPAWYYLNGGNKCGIGYEEIAWSQPREEQLVYARQIIHNASYARTMSMSWSHIPFSNYQGGGKDAAFLPFKEHQKDYDWVLAENLGNGVTGVFRGKRLYDKETLPILKKWVEFYKKHRGIVNGDIVHTRQAVCKEGERGRTTGLDTLLHVNALNKEEKGLLWVYNQTDREITQEIFVPLYYTGLTGLSFPPAPVPGSMGKNVHVYGKYPPNYSWLPQKESTYEWPQPEKEGCGRVVFRDENSNTETLEVDSNGNAHLKVSLPAMSFTYYLITGEKPGKP